MSKMSYMTLIWSAGLTTRTRFLSNTLMINANVKEYVQS